MLEDQITQRIHAIHLDLLVAALEECKETLVKHKFLDKFNVCDNLNS